MSTPSGKSLGKSIQMLGASIKPGHMLRIALQEIISRAQGYGKGSNKENLMLSMVVIFPSCAKGSIF